MDVLFAYKRMLEVHLFWITLTLHKIYLNVIIVLYNSPKVNDQQILG